LGDVLHLGKQGNKMKKTLTTLALATVLLPGVLSAEMSKEEIAKASQNPLTAMYSLPIQNNTNFGIGPDDKIKNVANIQPVLPFDISDDWTLVTRTILPVVYNGAAPQGVDKWGLGDTGVTGFFTPKATGKSGIVWGVGPTILLPTSTDDTLGPGEWGAGISGVALAIQGKWVYGALLSNIWSFTGDKSVDIMTFQPFVNYNLGDGLFIASVPIITANWEADSEHTWTLPLGLGMGKAMKMGKVPFTAQVHGYYNVMTPDDYGETWQMRVQVQWLFPR